MTHTNIYQTPSTDPSIQNTDKNQNNSVIQELSYQSTWKLFFFAVITLGIYSAHYIKRQSKVLNKYSSPERQISSGFVTFILILSYISVASLIPFFFIEVSSDLESMSNLIDFVWGISILVWAFKANSSVHELLKAQKGSSNWFHGLWTFLFRDLYFNYKVNRLNRLA
jgi:hypothetical protein